ncbi:MAG TPA: GntR family transcriptional regulator [Polyangiaceae bacterium]|nr:GntR family transcriptional regulator [Polyangiaceae bacterium]
MDTGLSQLPALNPGSPVPLYHQLATSLSAAIAEGRFKPGDRLPSEPELARRFGVTRPTVRQATRLLAERRLVEARRGSGTFVRSPGEQVDLFSLAGTLEAFERSGVRLERRLLGKIQKRLVARDVVHHPFAGRVAYHFRRLSRAHGRPVLLEDFYVDPTTFADLESYNLSVKSFARVVREHYFLRPVRGRQTFQTLTVTGEVGTLLELDSGEPVLFVRRTLDFPGAPAAVYVELSCRTAEFVFSQTLEGDP